jgi:hypothetical protein
MFLFMFLMSNVSLGLDFLLYHTRLLLALLRTEVWSSSCTIGRHLLW